MKCPLFMTSLIGRPDVIKDYQVECKKEGCAWYIKSSSQCVLLGILEELTYLHDTPTANMASLPHTKVKED